jgi:hypothetical protein
MYLRQRVHPMWRLMGFFLSSGILIFAANVTDFSEYISSLFRK